MCRHAPVFVDLYTGDFFQQILYRCIGARLEGIRLELNRVAFDLNRCFRVDHHTREGFHFWSDLQVGQVDRMIFSSDGNQLLKRFQALVCNNDFVLAIGNAFELKLSVFIGNRKGY